MVSIKFGQLCVNRALRLVCAGFLTPLEASGHPREASGHPREASGHPREAGGRPPVTGACPPVTAARALVSGGRPLVTDGRPPVTGGRPGAVRGCPLETSGRHGCGPISGRGIFAGVGQRCGTQETVVGSLHGGGRCPRLFFLTIFFCPFSELGREGNPYGIRSYQTTKRRRH